MHKRSEWQYMRNKLQALGIFLLTELILKLHFQSKIPPVSAFGLTLQSHATFHFIVKSFQASHLSIRLC